MRLFSPYLLIAASELVCRFDGTVIPPARKLIASTPVLPAVDCTMYNLHYQETMYITKRQRVVKSPQQIPLPPDEDSADTILQDAKRAFYESGAANFEEARRYYARLNEDFKKYGKRMVITWASCAIILVYAIAWS